MSADNAIYYRQIGDKWFVMEGSASCDYDDADYKAGGSAFDSKGEALEYASKLADECTILEYGICDDTPEPPAALRALPLPQAEEAAWDRIAQVAAELPEDAIAGIPVDGASQHDHYLYGTPKCEPAPAAPVSGLNRTFCPACDDWHEGRMQGNVCIRDYASLRSLPLPQAEEAFCHYCAEAKPTPHALAEGTDPYCEECWNEMLDRAAIERGFLCSVCKAPTTPGVACVNDIGDGSHMFAHAEPAPAAPASGEQRVIHELITCDCCGLIHLDEGLGDLTSCKCGRFKPRMDECRVRDVLKLSATIATLTAENTSLRSDLAELRGIAERMRGLIAHSPGCNERYYGRDQTCNCGFYDTKAEYAAFTQRSDK